MKQTGGSYLFVGVQALLFEAKALDLVEIFASLERDDVVGADSIYWSVCWVCGSVEGQCSLAKCYLNCFIQIQFKIPK